MRVPRMVRSPCAPLPGRSGLCLALLAVMVLAGCSKKSVTAPEPTPPARWVATSGPPGIYEVRCLAARGTNLFAGTSNGVYRSADKGASWSACGLTNWGVTTLASSGTHVYVGTYGDFRRNYRGLYYTINDGAGWWAILPDMFVSSVAIRDSALYAGTMDSGVFRRWRGQSDWTAVNNGLTELRIHSLAGNGTSLFAGTYSGDVFRSTDDGDHWVPASSDFDSTDVSDFAALGATLFAATGRGVFRSVDDGDNWVAVNEGLTSTNALDLAVDGSSLFVAIGAGGVFRTIDHGDHWTAMNNGLANLFVCSIVVSGTDLFAGTSQNGVWRYPLR